MKKRIGILGGISHESTIFYYDLILRTYYHRFQDYYYPEIVIYSLDFQKFTDFEDKGDKVGYIDYILHGIKALERAGVDLIIMAANSPHAVFKDVKTQTEIPMLSIAETTAKYAKNQNMKTLLLIGIRFTMQSSFYKDICGKYGIEVIVPSEEEQEEINNIIFEELVIGVFKIDSKKKILKIINNYKVDGVILGCTELPLLLRQEDTAVVLLNTVEIHVNAVLDFTLLS
ncbi:MAG: aspartate/glutamate racemase family protein [Promethearchaeota archaeon]